ICTVLPMGRSLCNARRHTRSRPWVWSGRSPVWVSIVPSPSRTTTNTPCKLNLLISSRCKPSPESTALAAASALSRAVFSTLDSKAARSKKKIASPETSMIVPITSALKSVRRQRIGKFLLPPQCVTNSPDCLDQLRLPGRLQFLAQVGHVDVHHVSLHAGFLPPDPRE